ncbi:MAG: hypothetical protein ACM3SQ_05465 [Betaproteobacteria bacterium]
MKVRAVSALLLSGMVGAMLATTAGCRGTGLFRQYEYEEDVYLSLDRTATIYVNSSIPALDALRGASFDTRPTARVNRAAVRAFFESPVTHVVRVSSSLRDGRRFVYVRLEVSDVRRLSETKPFAWSDYQFGRKDGLFDYRQAIGASAGKAVGDVGWNGRELVAFRLHLPSRIEYHNTDGVRRGNILVWEQPLADRLRGVPLTLVARMETESILYRTLWLFGLTLLAVGLTFGVVIWWVLRHGARAEHAATP